MLLSSVREFLGAKVISENLDCDEVISILKNTKKSNYEVYSTSSIGGEVKESSLPNGFKWVKMYERRKLLGKGLNGSYYEIFLKD